MKGEGKGFPRWVALVAVCACVAAPVSAHAAVVAPNTTTDEYDTVSDATCSLREAVRSIEQATNFGGCTASGSYNSNDTVQLPPGEYKLTIPPGMDDFATGDLTFLGTVAITALPGGPVEIDGNLADRLFQFSGSLAIDGVTLTRGLVNDPAMGSSVSGGAIFSSSGSSLTISDTTIAGNTADGFGGALAVNGPTSLTNVTISGNTTTELGGGGIEAGPVATLALKHVTLTGNRSTLDSPAQSVLAGGLLSQTSAATLHNSIIAGNTDANTTLDAPDCQGALTSQGGNVIGDDTGCTFTSMPTDDVGTTGSPLDPLLGPLADNGGTTFSHSLRTGSPAIDNGVATCLTGDQRGYPRPTGPSCDSGAYELFTCGGAPLNPPGPFTGCPADPAGNPPPADNAPPAVPRAKKCKRKKHKRSASAAKKKKCKKKRR